jgi:HEPN domain-containing protein
MDVPGQTEYWRNSSREDFKAAGSLLEKGHFRHALFFAELAVEKALKALVVKKIEDLPPRTHDLLRLAELAAVDLTDEQRDFLARFQKYCLEGRYPDQFPPEMSRDEAEAAFEEAKEALEWLLTIS